MNNIKSITLLVILLFLCYGCYGTITGKVVDAETGEPIEGAVVLVEWTIAKGLPGLTHTKSHKVIEAITDKEGKATISGVVNPFVDPPNITAYKKGYVAWNNKYIFPGYKKRTDFKWENGAVVRMERFRTEYSFIEHQSFINGAAHPERETSEKKLFIQSYRDEELEKVIKEREKRGLPEGRKK